MRQTFIIQFDKYGVVEKHCEEPFKLLVEYLKEKGEYDKLESVLPRMSRVWTEILTVDGVSKCVGLTTLAQVWDVACFHCEDDRSRARLMQRLSTVIEESVGQATIALVYVSEETEKDWIPMLEGMGAKRAHRWAVPAGAIFARKEANQNVLRS